MNASFSISSEEEISVSTSEDPLDDSLLDYSIKDSFDDFEFFQKKRDLGYEVLSSADLISAQAKIIEEVNNIFQIPFYSAKTLLQHFKWEKELLLEKYYDNPEATFLEAGVVNPFSRNNNIVQDDQSSSSLVEKTTNTFITQFESLECGICFSLVVRKSLYFLGCGHYFCVDCWNAYLEVKIVEEGVSQLIRCPQSSCSIIVDEKTVFKLLLSEEVKKKYEMFIANSYVSESRHLRWCPAQKCDNVIKVTIVEPQCVTCTCGHTFCFSCGEGDHRPLTCDLLKRWLKKCADDSETANWINAYTKECPNCKAVVEKNGGCNHMVCRNSNCSYEYCWVCLGPWKEHGTQWYKCNRYVESESCEARSRQDQSRELLRRYLHYFQRYTNHENSLKKEETLQKSVGDLMLAMQHQQMSWIEVQCIQKAVEILIKCRKTLTFTYVFAYYLISSNQTIIFEDNQRDLEVATEELSFLLEKEHCLEGEDGPPYTAYYSDFKKNVLDKSNLCNRRCDILLGHVQEGYDQNYWNFSSQDNIYPTKIN